MGLVDSIRRSIYGPVDSFSFQGNSYPLFGQQPFQLTQSGQKIDMPDGTLSQIASWAYRSNSIVGTLMIARQLVFGMAEFKWQNLTTRDVWGNDALRPLETPWDGGTTQNLLAKTIMYSDAAGNAFWRRVDGELVPMRPDWVDIVIGVRGDGTLKKAGYIYREGGRGSDGPVLTFGPDEVTHFMPLQDPESPWRGMSWLSPAIREITVDEHATTHQQKFFENAATPNLAVSIKDSLTREQYEEAKARLDDKHGGVHNAFKTLLLTGGADVTVVGADLDKLDLKSVQGRLETRIAALSGVGAVVAQFSEGMQGSSLNAGNYQAAKRRFADAVLYPLWLEAAGSFRNVVRTPAGSRLWMDTRHVPFLREDAKDAAEIMSQQISAVRQGVEAGFKPDAVVAAVQNDDLKQLAGNHTGRVSVQLLPTDGDPPGGGSDDDSPTSDGGAS